MTDIVISDLPDEVIAVIDACAAHLGISRSEYVRRRVIQHAEAGSVVTLADLERFAHDFADLANPDVIRAAWR